MSSTEQSVPRSLPGVEDARGEAARLLDEYSALLRQVGFSDILPSAPFAPEALQSDAFAGIDGIGRFLEDYHNRLLAPLELPAIARARGYAIASRTRELIKLDTQLTEQPLLAPFASASQKIGRCHLERLRPLRDDRTVQRYLAAVEAGDARAWHTVVYGLTLAVYSWPLRQGLMFYARQTLGGLARGAARSHSVSEVACGDSLDALFAQLPKAIEQTIGEFEIC